MILFIEATDFFYKKLGAPSKFFAFYLKLLFVFNRQEKPTAQNEKHYRSITLVKIGIHKKINNNWNAWKQTT